MSPMNPALLTDRHALAHQRALRAAQAVTLGLFALGAVGCSASVGPDAPRPVEDVAAADAAAEAAVADAPAADVSAADAGDRCDRDAGTDAYLACCQLANWDWNRGCEAWGPFVPPAMEG